MICWIHGMQTEGVGGLGIVAEEQGNAHVICWAADVASDEQALIEAVLLLFQRFSRPIEVTLFVANKALVDVVLGGRSLNELGPALERFEPLLEDAFERHEIRLKAGSGPHMNWAIALANWTVREAGARRGVLFDGDCSKAPVGLVGDSRCDAVFDQEAGPFDSFRKKPEALTVEQAKEHLYAHKPVRFLKEGMELYLVWKPELKEKVQERYPGKAVFTAEEFIQLTPEDVDNVVCAVETFKGAFELEEVDRGAFAGPVA